MLVLSCSIYPTAAQAQGSLFLKIQLNREAAAPEVVTEWVYSFSIVYTEGFPSSVNTTQVSCITVQATFSVKKKKLPMLPIIIIPRRIVHVLHL